MDILFRNPIVTSKTLITDKGTKIMEGLLLSQYKNSTNFKTYLKAFTEELDLLFLNIEKVYLGRFIETAIGDQLDIIGIILQQSRAVELPNLWFGFDGAPLAERMADEALPADGGLFFDENISGAGISPLDDETYRRVLMAKALLVNRSSADINLAYYFVATLLNKIPKTFIIEEIAHREVRLTLSQSSVTLKEVSLIYYMSKYFVPTGITFTIIRI